VCVGEMIEREPSLAALATGLAGTHRIHSPGWLPEEELVEAYRGAAALVLPSLYEGFGLPVLEAMACGTPVICANAASLPEVAGDAALCVPPGSEGELLDAIRAVTGDAALRASLRERGLRRAGLFSWQQCAESTLNLYRTLT